MSEDQTKPEPLNLPPDIGAAAMKVLNANGIGIIQLNAPEAEFIRSFVGMHLAQMKAAKDAGKVLLKDQKSFDAQFHGLGILYTKVDRAFQELLVEYNKELAKEKENNGPQS